MVKRVEVEDDGSGHVFPETLGLIYETQWYDHAGNIIVRNQHGKR